jgi:hypothetical protein
MEDFLDDVNYPERGEELSGKNPELFFADNTEESLKKAIEIIKALYKDEECQYDEGYCWTHYQGMIAGKCPNEVAGKFLKDFGVIK